MALERSAICLLRCGFNPRPRWPRDAAHLRRAERIETESRLVDGSQAVTTTYDYDAAGHNVSTTRIGTDGVSRIFLGGADYDTSGRLRHQTNALGGVTTMAYGLDQDGRAVISTTYPNGGTRREAYNRDGSLHQVSGSAVHGVRYEYQLAQHGTLLTKETRLDEAEDATPESVTEYTDLLGRPIKQSMPTAHLRSGFTIPKGSWLGSMRRTASDASSVMMPAANAKPSRSARIPPISATR